MTLIVTLILKLKPEPKRSLNVTLVGGLAQRDPKADVQSCGQQQVCHLRLSYRAGGICVATPNVLQSLCDPDLLLNPMPRVKSRPPLCSTLNQTKRESLHAGFTSYEWTTRCPTRKHILSLSSIRFGGSRGVTSEEEAVRPSPCPCLHGSALSEDHVG